MRIIAQIGVLLGVCLAGEVLSMLLPFPFPGSVLSLILLFLLLRFSPLKPSHLQETSDFLLQNMAFFFIPSSVSILRHFDLIRDKLFVFILICAVTTFITFAAAAFAVRGVLWLQKRRKRA